MTHFYYAAFARLLNKMMKCVTYGISYKLLQVTSYKYQGTRYHDVQPAACDLLAAVMFNHQLPILFSKHKLCVKNTEGPNKL